MFHILLYRSMGLKLFCYSGRKFFASSSCDGTLKIWETKSKECLKTLEIYPKSNDVDLSKVRGAVQFDEQENLIAAKENEVSVSFLLNCSYFRSYDAT